MNLDQVIVPDIVDRKFLGYRMAQTPEALLVFNEIFNCENFARVVEIGTFLGGFALYLTICSMVNEMKFFTFDIKRYGSNVHSQIQKFGGKFLQLDVFSSQGMNKLTSLIGSPGRVLLLCDGGDKKREIETFAKLLKPKDVIMGHDYFEKASDFFQQDKWFSCELVKEDIQAICSKYNLAPWYENVLKEVFWVGRIKQ